MKQIDIDYKIHIRQEFKQTQIFMHDLHYKKEYSGQIDALINAEWDEVTRNKDVFIFNGPVSCLDHYEIRGRDLHIYYCESDYKSYYGTNIKNSKNLKDKSDLANTLAVCTVVETSDNMLIVGKRGSQLAEGTCLWHVPGGTLEYYSNKENGPFEVMRKELAEELNLTCIRNMVCLGFGENLNFQKPEFLLYTQTDLTSSEIKEKLHLASDFNEHSEISFIPSNLIEKFLEENDFTEIGTAAIQLYLEKVRNMREESSVMSDE